MIDHDIVKSALLESLESTIDSKVAGKIAYNIDWSLVDFHLSQGQSVILDSPCMYTELLEKGAQLSKKYDARYKYVECFLSDIHEVDKRLRTRQKMISQVSQVPSNLLSEESFKITIENSKSKRPTDVRYLIIDTARSLDSYIDEVTVYINNRE